MEVWKIVFHSILEIFHSIPFWHLPYSIPKFPFHSIPYHALLAEASFLLRSLGFLKLLIVIFRFKKNTVYVFAKESGIFDSCLWKSEIFQA